MAFQHWDKLLWGIDQGECVLFLGPELPRVSPEGERERPVEALRERLLAGSEAEGSAAGGEEDDLARVAQRFVAADDELGLEMQVSRWHEEFAGARSVLHDRLATLPFRLIVTSAHDPLTETALREAGREPAVELYHYRAVNKELLAEPSVERPILFHLFGHVSEPRSVVLAETQLLDFLTALIAGEPPLPRDVNSALTNGRMFLFLGFGLERWYLRILLHVLKVLRRDSRAIAVEEAAADDAPGSSVLFFRENYKMVFHQGEVAAFVDELAARYTELRPASPGDGDDAAPAPQPVAAGAPRIFVCHASEDKDRAREVHGALQSAGLAPWLDRESLRGGDAWDARIETTIREEIDFFVVLNSRALAAKRDQASYVNKEINVARRAKDLRMGSFIIPVRLDGTPLVPELREFHAIDLAAPNGLRDLVRAIHRQAGA